MCYDFTEIKGNSEFDHVQITVELGCKTPFKMYVFVLFSFVENIRQTLLSIWMT